MTSPKILAYHEAGHIIAWMHYGYKFEFVSIDSKKCKETKSINNENCDGWISIKNNTSTPMEQSIFTISGCVAESRLRKCNLGKCIEEGGDEDAEIMDNLLDDYYNCLTDGLKDFNIGKGEPRVILTALAINESFGIINKNWEKIETVANELLKRKTLTYEEVLRLN